MSACGRAIDLLRDWREADEPMDEWELAKILDLIDPFFHRKEIAELRAEVKRSHDAILALTGENERLREYHDRMEKWDFVGDIQQASYDRDHYKRMAEWLAGHASEGSSVGTTADWLKAAGEATR